MPPADILDAAGCAQLLLCSQEQVEQLACDGEIPGTKLGSGWLFVRADLLVFLAARSRAEAAERRERKAAAVCSATV